MSKPKYTLSYCQGIATKNNGVLISKKVSGARGRLKWQCKKLQTWKASPVIANKGWCPFCGGRKYNISIINDLVVSKDGTLMSKRYKNRYSKLKIRCNKDGFIWITNSDHLQQGHWCPKCRKRAPITHSDIIEMAILKNVKILYIEKPIKAISLIKVKCLEDGREWETTYNRLQLTKIGCIRCAGNLIKPYKELVGIVEERGGIILSKEQDITNTKSIIDIICKNNHNFQLTYFQLIHHHTWCFNCKDNKTEIKLYNIIKDLFPKAEVNYRYNKFDWLKGRTFHKQEIDIFVEDIKLAIEYDGIQHFKPTNFGGMNDEEIEKRFEYIQEKDKEKNEKIKSHPEDVKIFIRIPYTVSITKDNVINILKNNNINIK